MTWNPEQYLKFAQPRLRPAIDLLNRIVATAPNTVCDLGCGAGNVTGILADRWPGSSIVGVDDSGEMLAKALQAYPKIQWRQGSIAAWKPEHPIDVIYSNAALHWLPNHRELLASLINQLTPQGTLAVQMPRNFSAPSHTLIAETVTNGPWRAELQHLLAPPPVAAPEVYHAILAPLSSTLDIWETEYLQVLQGPDAVKEWVKGTWLKQFLDALDPSNRADFERDYAQRLSVAYPRRADGSTLFPFKRLFIVAQR